MLVLLLIVTQFLSASGQATWIYTNNFAPSNSACSGIPVEQRGYEVNKCFTTYNNAGKADGSFEYKITNCPSSLNNLLQGSYNEYTSTNCGGTPLSTPLPTDPGSCSFTSGNSYYGIPDSYQIWYCSSSSVSPLTHQVGYDGFAITSTYGSKSSCQLGSYSQYIWSPVGVCVNSSVNGVPSSYQIQACSGSSSSTTTYVDDVCFLIASEVTSTSNCLVNGEQYYQNNEIYYNGVCTQRPTAAHWVYTNDYTNNACSGTPYIQEGSQANVCINTYDDTSNVPTGSFQWVLADCDPSSSFIIGYQAVWSTPNCPSTVADYYFDIPQLATGCTYYPKNDAYGIEASYRSWLCTTTKASPLQNPVYDGFAVTTNFGSEGSCQLGSYSQYIWSPTNLCINSTQNGQKSSYMITGCSGQSATTATYVDDVCNLVASIETSITFCNIDGNYYANNIEAYDNAVCTFTGYPPAAPAVVTNEETGYTGGALAASIIVCFFGAMAATVAFFYFWRKSGAQSPSSSGLSDNLIP